MKIRFRLLLSVLMVLAVIISGCVKKEDPRDTMQGAFAKVADMKSYEFDMGMKMRVDFSEEMLAEDPSMAIITSLLKNAEINVSGAYRQDPLQMEMNLEIALKGDMQFNFNIPIILTEDRMWVKVPQIPFFPLPDTIAGKFIEIDLNELSEFDSGMDISMMDMQKSQEFSQDLMAIIFSAFEGDEYFSIVNDKDVELPKGVEVKQLVKFSLENSNLESILQTLLDDALPQVLELLASEKYRDLLAIDDFDLDELKQELADSRAEINEAMKEIKDVIKIRQFELVTGIDKKGYMAYQTFATDLKFSDPSGSGQSVVLKLQLDNSLKKINEDVNFNIGIPKNTVTLDELMEEMMYMFMF